MTDKYTQFVSHGPGRDIARKLGLPQPVVLRRHQPGQPLVSGPVLVQGGGSGADALASILTWQDWEEMFALARFVGVSRPGYELDGAQIQKALKEMPADALTLVEVPALAISSTDCRKRAEEGRPIWYLVPDGVVQYVSKRNLYLSHALTPQEQST